MDAALDAVGAAGYVAIGERHDNPGHHRLQTALVLALQPRGIAFEMIPRAQEDRVNKMRADGAPSSEIGPAIGWDESGWPDWSLYAPILDAAPAAYIAGGGLSNSAIGALYEHGLAEGLDPDLTARYGLDTPLSDASLTAMLDEQFDAHCGMIERLKLHRMVDIQRAWDATYAEAWRRAAVQGGGRSVLICGNVHARLDRGAPALLRRALPDAAIASIGLFESGDDAPDGLAYTATLSAPRIDRGDPCEKMRAAMGGD